MRKGKGTREQAIAMVGIKLVEKLESLDCDFTNRVMGDPDESVEFSASVRFVDSEGIGRTLTAYYYQFQEDLDGVEDLSNLDWEIEGYEID